MDGVDDIHLRPDSMIYIRGEEGKGSLYTLSALWGGETLYSDTCASCSHLLKPGNSDRELQMTFFKASVWCAGLTVMSSVQFPGWSGVVGVQLWLIGTAWCNCGG